jgi:hypothetical protein
VWLRGNYFYRTTAAAVIVWSGIWDDTKWPGGHPNDPDVFVGHDCANVHIMDNDFDTIATAVVIDDHTVLSWITGNRISTHYAPAITIEDGSMWFVVTGNMCGPGRAAAVMLGGGQTGVFASRGIVANNTAAGCNDNNLTAPPVFFSTGPKPSAFVREKKSKHVVMTSNLDLPGG